MIEAIRINGYVDSALDWLLKHPVGWDTPHSLKDDAPQGNTLGEDPIIGHSLGGWGVLLLKKKLLACSAFIKC